MKKVSKYFLLLAIAGLIFTSCQNSESMKEKDSNSTTAGNSNESPINYPYTVKNPDNWETGSRQNTLVALSALKAWETGNMDESMKYFADSVEVRFDGISKKVSKDTLRALISPDKTVKSIAIRMDDWQSSVSKDKTDEWVSLWYMQYGESVNGKKDSIDVFNDIKLKDGKIIRLDEFRRKLH